MIVNGDDVTFYGLAAEHCLGDQVQWNGERGATYLFQSEMPYGVDQSFGKKGYVGYRVNQNVKEHVGYGIGVYHYFRDHKVVVETAISAPSHLESHFYSPLAVYLNGQGRIKHILNDKGNATYSKTETQASPEWVCDNLSPPGPVPKDTEEMMIV